MAAMRTRSRSNSFRGKEMHDKIRGNSEVVDDLRAVPCSSSEGFVNASDGSTSTDVASGTEGNESESSSDVPPRHIRRDSVMPIKSCTLSIRQEVRKRITDIGELPQRLSPEVVQEFKELVNLHLNVNREEIELFRIDPTVEKERMRLEGHAVQLFFYFDNKEQSNQKLSIVEFELKSMVDDVLVKLLQTSPSE